MSVDRFRYAIAHEYRYVLLKNFLIPSQWYFICLTFDTTMATFFLDGEIIDIYQVQLKERPQGSRITVAYIFPSPFAGITYIGNITQVNIWQKLLPQDTIRSLHRCHFNLVGDVVNWSAGQWADQGSTRHKTELFNVCKIVDNSKTIEVFGPVTFDEATYVCEGFGGALVTPSSHEEVAALMSIVTEEYPNCTAFWSGYWDGKEEGKWNYHAGEKKADKIPWAPNEPNGIHFENCGGIDKEGIVDADCNAKRHVLHKTA